LKKLNMRKVAINSPCYGRGYTYSYILGMKEINDQDMGLGEGWFRPEF
jgi:hypothetical protein